MSQENVDLFASYAVAFNSRDFPAMAELTHAEFEFVSILSAVDETIYTGSEAWTDYFAAMDQAWEAWNTDDFRIIDAGGDQIAVICDLSGTSKHGGVPLKREIGMTCTFRDGKVWRMRSYLDPNDALRAVGLRR
jgi:ketosteroid isomerase-like protein